MVHSEGADSGGGGFGEGGFGEGGFEGTVRAEKTWKGNWSPLGLTLPATPSHFLSEKYWIHN